MVQVRSGDCTWSFCGATSQRFSDTGAQVPRTCRRTRAAESAVGDMGQIKSYRDLDTWQVGMEVVEHTYRITRLFPNEERFGLCSQMRRASVSVPSNVAESHGRGLVRGCLYFLSVSIGSTAELDTQLEAARRRRFVSPEQATDLQASIDRV